MNKKIKITLFYEDYTKDIQAIFIPKVKNVKKLVEAKLPKNSAILTIATNINKCRINESGELDDNGKFSLLLSNDVDSKFKRIKIFGEVKKEKETCETSNEIIEEQTSEIEEQHVTIQEEQEKPIIKEEKQEKQSEVNNDIIKQVEPIKVQPTQIEQETRNIDETLEVVLENIKKQAEMKTSELSPNNETKKLELELKRKKLELINLWLASNKSEQ
jgi:hypothetical protein